MSCAFISRLNMQKYNFAVYGRKGVARRNGSVSIHFATIVSDEKLPKMLFYVTVFACQIFQSCFTYLGNCKGKVSDPFSHAIRPI